MFTGIITDIGTIHSISNQQGDWHIAIQTSYDLSRVDIGASIACSGCCLTVVKKQNDVFFVDVSHETLSKTNLGGWKEGTKINLERSLKIGDELGGHIVSGHVDGIAQLVSVIKDNDSWRLTFEVPVEFGGFIASKGSIALDGISLTVNEVNDTQFGVNIIPHTWENTTLGQRVEGDFVHFEIDMLARYVARMRDYQA